MKAPRAEPIAALTIGLVCSVAIFGNGWFYGQLPSDDAYIFMRIARGWLEWGAPYFNRGEAVMGHSSHLWLWLVTALFRLFGYSLRPLLLVSALLYVLDLWLGVLLLLRQWPGKLLPAVLVSAAINLLFLEPAAALVMETPLAVALLLATLLAIDSDRSGWLGLLAGSAFLARYELAALFAIAWLLSRRRLRFLAGASVPLVLFLVFTLHYFGTLVPQTALAKSRAYFGARTQMLERIGLPGLTLPIQHGIAVAAFVVLAATLLVWSVQGVRKQGLRWPAAALWFSLSLIGAHFAKNSIVFAWYWPLMLVPLFFGACALATPARRRWIAPALLTLVLWPAVSDGLLSGVGFLHRWPPDNSLFKSSLRTEGYEEIGRRLKRESLGEQPTVLASEIGALGWALFPLTLEDSVGLVTPAASRYHPMKVPEERDDGLQGAIPPGLVNELKPAFVVSLPVFARAFERALHDDREPGYALDWQIPVIPVADQRRYQLTGELWGSVTIAVWRRTAR